MQSRLWNSAFRCAFALGLPGLVCDALPHLAAQESARPEVVLVNLLNPMAVAIQPDTQCVFISSRLGVYRYDPNYKDPAHHQAVVEIDGYLKEADEFGPEGKYQIAPLGLAFLDKDHLVVGGGNRKVGEEVVRIYKIPPKPPAADSWMREDAAAYTLGPIKAGKDSSTGEGNFLGVAVGAGGIWVTCQGDASKGWIAKSEVTNGKPGALKPAIATKAASQIPSPGPIAFTPDGKELVVGQFEGKDAEGTSRYLTFYDPLSGSLKRKVKTNLHDVSGLAYSPKTKKLYATDLAWSKPDQGGLVELSIEGDAVKTTRVSALDKPTALAFDPEGHLYVSVLNTGMAGKHKGERDDPGGLVYWQPGL